MKILSAVCITVSVVVNFGCAGKHWIAPAVDGAVMDSTSREGIEGVEISRIRESGKAAFINQTEHDGAFTIEARRQWGLALPLADPSRSGSYSFAKEGYETEVLEYRLTPAEVSRKDPPRLPNKIIKLQKP